MFLPVIPIIGLPVEAYHAADTRILSRSHLAQLLIVLGIIGREGVDVLQHRSDGPADDCVRIEGIYVEDIKLLVYIVEDLQVAADGRIRVLILLRSSGEGQYKQTQQGACKISHLSVIIIMYYDLWSD